jgi:hypothetical protein
MWLCLAGVASASKLAQAEGEAFNIPGKLIARTLRAKQTICSTSEQLWSQLLSLGVAGGCRSVAGVPKPATSYAGIMSY